jgi:methionine-rich copper-binding protein CopC
MKIPLFLSGVALVTFGVTANAHAHLQTSSPADNSVITSAPSNLVLNFSEAARLTALSLQKDNEPKQSIKPLVSAAAQQISVPLPALAPGVYAVIWRVVADDGHVMSGTLHFTLAPDSMAAPSAPH